MTHAIRFVFFSFLVAYKGKNVYKTIV